MRGIPGDLVNENPWEFESTPDSILIHGSPAVDQTLWSDPASFYFRTDFIPVFLGALSELDQGVRPFTLCHWLRIQTLWWEYDFILTPHFSKP